jgi:hypothetical protein
MEQWIEYVAMGLFYTGAVLVTGAMLLGTVSGRSRAIALLRGSFQRRVDYTPRGWRCYWIGVVLCVSAVALIICGRFFARCDCAGPKSGIKRNANGPSHVVDEPTLDPQG